MHVTKISTNAFWKGETEVKGTVEENGSSFAARLYIKGSHVYDYSCSCIQGNSYRGMCAHCATLQQEYRKREEQLNQKPVITTPSVRTMIREYTNHEVAQIIRAGEEEKVTLAVRLSLSGRDVKAEFKVGRDRMYLIKDLSAFVKAVQEGAYVEYGKQLAFHHNRENFAPECRELLDLVENAVLVYQEHFKMFQKSAFSSAPALRELSLGPALRDILIHHFLEKNLEITDAAGKSRRVYVADGNPVLEVSARPLGRDGICVAVSAGVQAFFGVSHLYVLDGPVLYVCDAQCSTSLKVFLDLILYSYGGTGQVDIQKKDIPLFYERVLKKIEPYINLKSPEIHWEEYQPEPLRARFFFDSDGESQVSVEPVLSYGDVSFSPMEDENLPRQVCRDVPEEFRISQTLLRYFKHRDVQGKRLFIQNQNEELYTLIKYGIGEFMGLGEVVLSDAFRQIRILPPEKIQVNVSMSEGWLDLSLDAEAVSGEELMQVLQSYQEKKKFYRMKNGDFLELGEDGLLTVAQIVGDLGLTEEQIKSGHMHLPTYRAMYLDQMLKEGKGVSLYRDALFRSVIRGMKAMEDSEFEIPDSLDTILREYQKTGYRWLKTLDYYGFGGILADDMGLGKTLQMIVVLVKEAQEHPNSLSLVVCPASLVYNWQSEFQKYAPQMRVTVVVGNASERAEILEKVKDGQAQVLITSYDLLRRDLESYQKFAFRYQVLDEAQYIKNAATQSAKAAKAIASQTRFALTGTPIENSLAELWSIMDFLMPGFLFSYAEFRREIEVPVAKNGEEDKLSRLHRLIGPFVLRRLKKDVLKELPEKMEMVVYSGLEEEQKRLYEANVMLLKKQLQEPQGSSTMKILAGLTRLRQICCDPGLCYEGYQENSAKLDTCLGLVENGIAAGHRILLFSQFTTMLDKIGSALKERGISYYLLTGATSKEERRQYVMEFGKNDTAVFLISLKAGGTGLNLTAADMVIHYDPWWNEAAQNQATDRAHRIGQDKQVSVFKLIMKGSIEEGILKLQSRKRRISEQAITEGMVSLESLSREDIVQMLAEQ